MTQAVRLGDLFRVGSSKRVLKSQWQSEGVPFYRGREVTRLAAYGVVENELFISESLYQELSSQYGVPDAGDIMVTAIGTIGNSYVVGKGDRFYFKDASVLWLKKTADVSSEFVNYWLKSDMFFGQLDRGNGATVDTLTIQKLQSVGIDLPPLPAQRRIVAILDEAFECIATAKSNTEKNLQSARELLQVQHEAIFSKVDGRLIRLGDIASFRNGINYTKQSKGREVRIVGVRDFQNHLWAPLDELEAVTLDGELSAADTLAEGDILTVRSNGNPELIGRCMLVGALPEPVSHSGFTIRIRLNREDALPLYVCQFMRSRPVRRQLVDGGNGANIKSLNQGALAGIELRLPTIDVQKRVVKQLDAISIETERLAGIARAKLAALEELKSSLLHQAFTSALSLQNDRSTQGHGLQMCTQ